MSKRKAGPASGAFYRLEAQVGHLLRRAHQRASATFLKHIGDPQITPTQFAALVKLADEGELGQNHLGRLTAMDPATIQGVIRRLKARALIAMRQGRRRARPAARWRAPMSTMAATSRCTSRRAKA